ncbi:MAG: hypothetical protein WC107_03610 [Patescibacteria group bacterium]
MIYKVGNAKPKTSEEENRHDIAVRLEPVGNYSRHRTVRFDRRILGSCHRYAGKWSGDGDPHPTCSCVGRAHIEREFITIAHHALVSGGYGEVY